MKNKKSTIETRLNKNCENMFKVTKIPFKDFIMLFFKCILFDNNDKKSLQNTLNFKVNNK